MATGISIQNMSRAVLTASISLWGDKGDPGRFPVKTGETVTWPARADARGYIVYLEQGGQAEPFYVLPGHTVEYYAMSEVTCNGLPLHPINSVTAFEAAVPR